MEPRPSMRRNCCSSLSSLTESAVGLTDEGCWAGAGGASATSPANASAAKTSRRRATSGMPLPPFSCSPLPVTALHHPFLVDLGDDLAVAGQQRFGRAHLRAHRQLAFGEAVGAVFVVFLRRVVGLGPAGAIGALVHLAAGAE